MASGSLTTNNRPQKKRRSTNNSSNNSSSQAATALSGKVRNSCQLESGRRGRGGNAKAGCVCVTSVTAVASLSTSMRDGLARLDGHADAALRMQVGPGDRLDRAARHETKAEALRQHRDRDDDLDERKRGADADMRTDREGQIGVARAGGDLVRREAAGIEAVGVVPQHAMAVHDPGKDADDCPLRDLAAAHDIVGDGARSEEHTSELQSLAYL